MYRNVILFVSKLDPHDAEFTSRPSLEWAAPTTAPPFDLCPVSGRRSAGDWHHRIWRRVSFCDCGRSARRRLGRPRSSSDWSISWPPTKVALCVAKSIPRKRFLPGERREGNGQIYITFQVKFELEYCATCSLDHSGASFSSFSPRCVEHFAD